MKWNWIVCLTLVLPLGGCDRLGGNVTTNIKLTASDLQPEVSSAFPIEVEQSAIKIQLTNPRVKLDRGKDTLGLETDVVVVLPKIGLKGRGEEAELPRLTGKTVVEGKIAYDKTSGTIYFQDGDMVDFKVDQIPSTFEGQVKNIASAATRKQLKKIDIYTLDASKYEEKAAKALLQDVAVADGRLVLSLGMGTN